MSDRDEFDKWLSANVDDCDDIGSETLFECWQAARTQSGQEAVATIASISPMDCTAVVKWSPGQNGQIPAAIDKIGAKLYTRPQPAQQGSVPKGENDFGLDARYFHEKLSLILRGINSYTPTEMARALGRLAITANPETMQEPEFSIRDLIDEPKYRDATAQPQGDGWIKCSERLPEPRDSGRKAPNGILVKFDTGRITQIHDVTETLVARMKSGPRHPAKFEAPTPPRIVEWMDLDNPQPPKEGKGDE